MYNLVFSVGKQVLSTVLDQSLILETEWNFEVTKGILLFYLLGTSPLLI